MDNADYLKIQSLRAECANWQKAAKRASVRAEQLEDALEKAEREREAMFDAIVRLKAELEIRIEAEQLEQSREPSK